jgi:hypothetical protein
MLVGTVKYLVGVLPLGSDWYEIGFKEEVIVTEDLRLMIAMFWTSEDR